MQLLITIKVRDLRTTLRIYSELERAVMKVIKWGRSDTCALVYGKYLMEPEFR